MMPSVLRRSGPDFERDGVTVTPRALVSYCEDCGSPAPFLISSGGKLRSWCGWRNGEPVCVNQAKEATTK